MKIRRLSEIDLARIAPLDREEKLHRLRILKAGRPPHTYNPFRRSLGDILNLQPELFAGGPYTDWQKIEANVKKLATTDTEEHFNLAVAEALYDFGVSEGILSYRKAIAPWAVGYGQSVTYWWNLYTIVDGRPCFLFVDPRLSNPLTQSARLFSLSIMHERIRVPDPDFNDARLLIVQFGKGEKGKRVVRLFDDSDVDLYSFDQLNEMIDETYQLWLQVLSEREEDAKKRPTGSTPMGF